jgi:hypothetical protein
MEVLIPFSSLLGNLFVRKAHLIMGTLDCRNGYFDATDQEKLLLDFIKV